MKRELGMVGWPTKTLAINTIDLPQRDGREVEGREADREKNRKKIEARGSEAWIRQALSIVQLSKNPIKVF